MELALVFPRPVTTLTGMSTMTEVARNERSEQAATLVEREALRLHLIGGCRDAEVSLRVQAARALALAVR